MDYFNIIRRSILAALFFFAFAGPGLLAQDYITEANATGKLARAYEKATRYSHAGDFDRALKELDKLLESEPAFVDAWLLRAAIYYDQGRLAEAEADFERGLALAPDYEPITLYRLALTELRQKNYPEAVEHFDQFLATEPRGDRLRERTLEHLSDARFRAEAMRNPVPYEPRGIGTNINTPDWEYLPSFTADGKYLVYTARRNNQEDLFISEQVDGEWQKGQPLEQINTPMSEGAQNISADGRMLVFTACNRREGYGSCDLYFSAWQGSGWSKPANLGNTINSGSWESQPSLSADGRTLYFASDRPGGIGKRDIWVSRLENGKWGEPQNLGPVINTPDDDESPFMHPDGKTLYFMSKGHPGMGGSDIFVARKDDEGAWQVPENLGYPINTEANEGALVVSLDGKTAYFASDQLGELGYSGVGATTDIYSFELHPAARPEPVTYVRAVVRDADTGEPLSAVVEFVNLDTEAIHLRARTGSDGAFLSTLPLGADYGLNVSRSGYLFHSENFALSDKNSLHDPFLLEIDLRPVPGERELGSEDEPEEPVVLRNVFFETGSAALKSGSRMELDRLKSLLDEHPSISIQINGHTDDVGEEADNLKLSEDRAQAVLDYLVQAGIDPGRLQARGFGESRPIAPNDNPEGRQRNRRTEFVVLGGENN